MICVHVKRSSAVKYVSLACQKFFNYALTPTKSEREREREEREHSCVYFGWRWKAGNVFLREGVEKWQPTRLVIACVLCLSLWQSVCYGRHSALSYICSSCFTYIPLSRTLPQSAWHIPLWCAFNCSKILKQFLFRHLHLLLLLRSCQRICHKFILIFDSHSRNR